MSLRVIKMILHEFPFQKKLSINKNVSLMIELLHPFILLKIPQSWYKQRHHVIQQTENNRTFYTIDVRTGRLVPKASAAMYDK